jgi:deazaflavin-dependent oxidoreductase (nitroreductase family)
MKRRVVRLLQRHVINPRARTRARRGAGTRRGSLPGGVSGQPRQTPVGNGLQGDTSWIVAEHGRQADYVRDLSRNPRVRVEVDGRWRSGTAHLLPDDDPLARQRTLDPENARAVRLMGTDLLTVSDRP